LRCLFLDSKYRLNQQKVLNLDEARESRWFKIYTFFSKKRAHYWLLLFSWIVSLLLVILIVALEEGVLQTEKIRIDCYLGIRVLKLLYFAFVGILSIFYIFRLWNVSDAYEMRTELFVLVAGFPFVILVPTLVATSGQSEFIFLITQLLCAIFFVFVNFYYPIYLSYRPEWRINEKNENGSILSSGSNTQDMFRECLEGSLQQEFKVFCTELWCPETIMFYLQVQEYKTLPQAQREEMVKSTITNFILPESPAEVNLDQEIQAEIISRAERGEFTLDLFDRAQLSVKREMLQDIFTKFQSSGRLEKAKKKAGLDILLESSAQFSKTADELLQMDEKKSSSPGGQ